MLSSVAPANAVNLEEKIEWNERSLQGYEDYMDTPWDIPQFIEVDRNLRDDTFNIVAPRRISTVGETFTVNNQELEGVLSAKAIKDSVKSEYSVLTAHRSLFKSVHLADATEISVRQDAYTDGSGLAFSMSLFPQIESMNKNINLLPGQYIKLKAINSIKFATTPNKSASAANVITDGTLTPEITWNITYIVPRKFNEIEGNQSLFDIYTKNTTTGGSIYADYASEEGKITATSLGKSGLKTYFQPVDQPTQSKPTDTLEEGDDPQVATKVGEVQLFDNQFYNYDTKKVETGYGINSVEGLLVPYDFKGEFKENVKFTPNAAFKDLSINMSHQIKQPLLNKYDGKIILNIEDTDKSADNFKIIPSEKIRMLADYDPTISGLERISHEETL